MRKIVTIFTLFVLCLNVSAQSAIDEEINKISDKCLNRISASSDVKEVIKNHILAPEIRKQAYVFYKNYIKKYKRYETQDRTIWALKDHYDYEKRYGSENFSKLVEKASDNISYAEAWISCRQHLIAEYSFNIERYKEIMSPANEILKKFKKSSVCSNLFEDQVDAIYKGVILHQCDSILLAKGNSGMEQLGNSSIRDAILISAVNRAQNLPNEITLIKVASIEAEQRIAIETAKEQQRIYAEKLRKAAESESSLLELAKSEKDYGYDVREKILEIGKMIENKELSFVDIKKGGYIYRGWVDKDGQPCGLFHVAKREKPQYCDDYYDDDYFVSLYYKGEPFAYGIYYKNEIHVYGVFNKSCKANGPGGIKWPSGAVYTGGLKDNFQHGYGVTQGHWGDESDNNLTGIFKDGKLITSVDEVISNEYKTNSVANLSPEYKIVTDLGLGNDFKYSGNWKDGAPCGYGCTTRGHYGEVGYVDGDYKKWDSYPGYFYYEEHHNKSAIFGHTLKELGFTNAIQTSESDVFYVYDVLYRKTCVKVRCLKDCKDQYGQDASQVVGTMVYGSPRDVGVAVYDIDGREVSEVSINDEGVMTINNNVETVKYFANGDVIVYDRKSQWLDYYKFDGKPTDTLCEESGVKYLANGDIFIGGLGWNGGRDGYGMLLFSDGELKQQGRWEKDEFKEVCDVSQYLRNSSGTKNIIAKALSKASSYSAPKPTPLSASFVINL